MEKSELRKKMFSLLKNVSPEMLIRAGESACEKIISSAEWLYSDKLLVFLSMKNEIDTMPLIKKAFVDKKEVYAPRIKNKTMNFYRIKNLDGGFTLGAFGIREPRICSADSVFIAEKKRTLIITPGLAFDKKGNRLGRGAGFYDRFFSELPGEDGFFLCGFCLDSQIINDVPYNKFDKKINALCSEKEFVVLS